MIENKKRICRLNHFVLWCKGWYESVVTSRAQRYGYLKKFKERDVFEDVIQILKLDGYVLAKSRNDVLTILLNFIDELVDRKVLTKGCHPLRMIVWHGELQKYFKWTGGDFERSLLLVIRDFFKYHIDSKCFDLTPPEYSRALFKMGFVCPSHYGNSYKMCNHKVKQLFNLKAKRKEETK